MARQSTGQHQPLNSTLSRRRFVQGMSALLAAGALQPKRGATARSRSRPIDVLPEQPNFLILITDQERYPQWWPQGWADANLPNRKRIADHGLSFRRAFCNSAMCSPSRSTLFTGLYPAQHGVLHTLTTGGSVSATQPTLSPELQNMARLLASAGYNVHYRGKWHMSKGSTGDEPTPEDIAAFGFHGWEPPEAGEDTDPAGFGGGCANHDARYAAQAVEFLNSVDPDTGPPFALIVSLVNPHDVLAYPRTWNQQDAEDPACFNYLSAAPQCFTQGIPLPNSYGEDLASNFKPTAHRQMLTYFAAGLGALTGPTDPQRYVNFYAYLQKEVDQHIGAVLDALEAQPGLKEKTIIIRTSDHGELGLAHGGLRQKAFNVYEETLNVPLVFSNPILFPNPVETGALASLIDLMPTLATLARAPGRESWTFLGRDLTPVIEDAAANPLNPTATVQDAILFTFDDENAGAPNGQNIVTQPNHIRCLREARWKYAVYFDPNGAQPPQYELYDLEQDPTELHNLANPENTQAYDAARHEEMHARLFARMAETGTLPHHLHLPMVVTPA